MCKICGKKECSKCWYIAGVVLDVLAVFGSVIMIRDILRKYQGE